MGVVISVCGYGLSLFGLPHIPTSHITIPESVYSSLNALQVWYRRRLNPSSSTPPVRSTACSSWWLPVRLVLVSPLGFLNIFFNFLTHRIAHVNGAPYRLQSACYCVACVVYAAIAYTQSLPAPPPLSLNTAVSLLICCFACIVATFYLHSMTNRFLSERLVNKAPSLVPSHS